MIVSTRTIVNETGGDSRKAGIKRQIQKLEKKRQELMEKLAKAGASGGDSSAAAPSGGKTAGTTAGTTAVGGGNYTADELGQILRDFRASLSGDQNDDSGLPPEEPKEIMKQLQLHVDGYA